MKSYRVRSHYILLLVDSVFVGARGVYSITWKPMCVTLFIILNYRRAFLDSREYTNHKHAVSKCHMNIWMHQFGCSWCSHMMNTLSEYWQWLVLLTCTWAWVDRSRSISWGRCRCWRTLAPFQRLQHGRTWWGALKDLAVQMLPIRPQVWSYKYVGNSFKTL